MQPSTVASIEIIASSVALVFVVALQLTWVRNVRAHLRQIDRELGDLHKKIHMNYTDTILRSANTTTSLMRMIERVAPKAHTSIDYTPDRKP